MSELYIDRIIGTYGKYGIKRETVSKLFDDGIQQQNFTPLECYNLIRMVLAKEYNEREYFSIPDVATMLDMTEDKIIKDVLTAKKGNKEVMNSITILFPNGIRY